MNYNGDDDDLDNIDEYDEYEDEGNGLSDELKDKVNEKIKNKLDDKIKGSDSKSRSDQLNNFSNKLTEKSNEIANKGLSNASNSALQSSAGTASRAASTASSTMAGTGTTVAGTGAATAGAGTAAAGAATAGAGTAAAGAGTAAAGAATAGAGTAAAGAGAAAAGAGAGAAAGSVVPVVGTIIGALAGVIAGKIAEKKKKEKENGENSENKKGIVAFFLSHKFITILLIVIIVILLLTIIANGEEQDITQSLFELVERREEKNASTSDITYEKWDESTNKNIQRKPFILFSEKEVDDLLYTSYNKDKDGNYTAFSMKNLIEKNLLKNTEVNDPCYSQILSGEGTNEVAQFVSTLGTIDELDDENEDNTLKLSTDYVKSCLKVEIDNFNATNWHYSSGVGSYNSTKKHEEFKSLEELNSNKTAVISSGSGTSFTDITDLKKYRNTQILIPNLDKYNITTEDHGIFKSSNESAEVKALMEYVSLIEPHLLTWQVPYVFLMDTDGNIDFVNNLIKDAASDVDVTLYSLMEECLTQKELYYLQTESYYTYDVNIYEKKDIEILGKKVGTTTGNKISGGSYNTKDNPYSGGKTYVTGSDGKQSTKDNPVGKKNGSESDVGVYESTGESTIRKVENIKLVTALKRDGNGTPLVAKNDSGSDDMKSVSIDRNFYPSEIIPKLTSAADMYEIFSYSYEIIPISEEDSPVATDDPVKEFDEKSGTVTITKKSYYRENLSESSATTEKYALSYLSEEEVAKRGTPVSRIEWMQDCGKLTEGGTSDTLVGSEITEKIWNYLKSKGCSDIAVAAIMGNMEAESSFNPGSIEVNSSPDKGHGLCQWTFGRWTTLEKRANEAGVAWNDIGLQLDYLWDELTGNGVTKQLTGSSCTSINALNSMPTIAQATEAFCWSFERPRKSTAHIDRRISSAQKIYDLYAGKENTDSSTENSDSNTNENKNKTKGEEIAAKAASYVGLKYVFGTQDLNVSVDCSGFTMSIYKLFGYTIARTAASQYNEGTRIYDISTKSLAPGDLLFKENTYKEGISHVGIYLGGGKIVHASDPTRGVIISDLDSSWVKATRILSDNDTVVGLDKSVAGDSNINGVTGKVVFGAGNNYTMYPSKTAEEKRYAYNTYIGEKKSKNGIDIPKGYSRDDLTYAFSYIEQLYLNVLTDENSNTLENSNAVGGESATSGSHYKTTYTLGGRIYCNFLQNTYDSSYRYGGKTVAVQGCTIISISIIAKAFGTDNYLEKCCTGSGKYVNSYAYVVSDLNSTTHKQWQSYPGPTQGGSRQTATSKIDDSISKGYPVLIECLGAARGGTSRGAGGFTNGRQHWMVLCDMKVENGTKYYYIETLAESNTGWFTSDMLLKNLNTYYTISE